MKLIELQDYCCNTLCKYNGKIDDEIMQRICDGCPMFTVTQVETDEQIPRKENHD